MTEFQKWCQEILPIAQAGAGGAVIQYNSAKNGNGTWFDLNGAGFLPGHSYRIKRRTIMIGDMEVPEPMRVSPEIGATFFLVDMSSKAMVDEMTWDGAEWDKLMLYRGICHSTREAAITHAEALIARSAN